MLRGLLVTCSLAGLLAGGQPTALPVESGCNSQTLSGFVAGLKLNCMSTEEALQCLEQYGIHCDSLKDFLNQNCPNDDSQNGGTGGDCEDNGTCPGEDAGDNNGATEDDKNDATEDNNGATEDDKNDATEDNENPDNEDQDNEDQDNEEESELPVQIQEVLTLVNEARAENGLAAVTYSAEIAEAAQARAAESAISFSHTRPNGTSFSTVLGEYGISYRQCGENIAYGQKNAEEVMNAWMNSPSHRANILNGNYSEIGIGYYVNANGTIYWSQLFVR